MGLQIRAYLILSWPGVAHVTEKFTCSENEKEHGPPMACEVAIFLVIRRLACSYNIWGLQPYQADHDPGVQGLKPITVIK